MTRRRTHARAPQLYRWADAVEDLRKLVEINAQPGDAPEQLRDRLLQELAIFDREVLVEQVARGKPVAVPVWQAIGVRFQGRREVAATEAELAQVAAEDLADYEWTREQIAEGLAELQDRRGGLDGRRTRETVDELVYVWPGGTDHLAFVRHPIRDLWKRVELDAGEIGSPSLPANETTNPRVPERDTKPENVTPEPEAPPLRVLEGGGETSPGAQLVDAVNQLQSTMVEDLHAQLGEISGTLRRQALEPDGEWIVPELERLEADMAHAGDDPSALTEVFKRAGALMIRAIDKVQERRRAALALEETAEPGGTPAEGELPEAVPNSPDDPGGPADGGGEAAGSTVPATGGTAGIGPDASPGPEAFCAACESIDQGADPWTPHSQHVARRESAPPCVAFEEEQEALANLAVELGTEQGRALALEHVRRATHPDQLAAIRAGILSTLESERRVREQLEAHAAKARENLAKRKADEPKPSESALARARREARAADQATKDDPATKELRARVRGLVDEVWPVKGTAPRGLIDALKDTGFQGLKLQEEQLLKQIAARREKEAAKAAAGGEA